MSDVHVPFNGVGVHTCQDSRRQLIESWVESLLGYMHVCNIVHAISDCVRLYACMQHRACYFWLCCSAICMYATSCMLFLTVLFGYMHVCNIVHAISDCVVRLYACMQHRACYFWLCCSAICMYATSCMLFLTVLFGYMHVCNIVHAISDCVIRLYACMQHRACYFWLHCK